MKAAITLAVLACLVFATGARASSTIVPDNYSKIQTALNANIDTVWVKAGTYNETLSITHGVFLSFYDKGSFVQVPIILRVTGSLASGSGPVTVRGFHVLRSAALSGVTSGACEFSMCRVDSGITLTVGQANGRVMGCTVFGPLSVTAAFGQVLCNTVTAGAVVLTPEAGDSHVEACYVTGPAATGITLHSDGYASDNLVSGCVDGIRMGCFYTGVKGNTVQDCSGTGITATGTSCNGPDSVTNNIVLRCGSYGILASGTSMVLDGNTVDSTGLSGMNLSGVTTDHVDNNTVSRAGGAGMVMATVVGHMRGNTVYQCAGNGMTVNLCPLIDHNVAGHNGGTGIAVTSDDGTDRLRSNTVYLNSGPGISLQTSDASLDSVSNNIGYGNRVGLTRLGAGSIWLGCNDWYLNTTAATSGVSVGATDFAANPEFCNAPEDNVSLALTSPALNRAGCGLVGALWSHCASPAAVETGPGSLETSLRAFPQPNRGVMRFAWKSAGEPARLEVFDAAGALRYTHDVAAGVQELLWSRTDSGGGALPAGVYFARLRAPGRELGSCRVVVLK